MRPSELPPPPRLHLLIVEDNDDDALMLERELRRGGLDPLSRRVDSAADMRMALGQLAWDIVIADHNMPSFSSFDALNILKDSGLDLPFLVVSGSIGEDIAVEIMKAGAHDYIMKDKLARLLPAINRELKEANVRKARRQAEALLRYHANHDALTGLTNRREFEIRLERAVAGARTEGRRHALAYIDLDQFKLVNDTCGHVAGDELLKQLAALLKEGVRDSDTLSRLGGDEFGILFEDCELALAEGIAADLLAAIRKFRFAWLDKSFEIAASIGLVTVTSATQSGSELLSTADVACYAAKDFGRNRVHVYQANDVELAKRQGEMYWAYDITKALDDSRFLLFYQKIVPLNPAIGRGQIYEVLVRMRDEKGIVVRPGDFIPAAERYNLMPAIDRWVVKAVFELIASLKTHFGRAPGITFTVNLSGLSLSDASFVNFVRNNFVRLGLPRRSVCFEITETAAISNVVTAVNFMAELKTLGIEFLLDDFGSGLSSFAYLKNLPVDYLKIDGSFMEDIVNDPIDYAMVEAINKVGQIIGVKTIAECVEDELILDAVKRIGLDYAQGFAIHKPELLEREQMYALADV